MLRSELVCWLLTDTYALEYVHPRGVQIYAADFPQQLDLEEARVERRLTLGWCRLISIDLLAARTRSLNFHSCELTAGYGTTALRADGLVCVGTVFLRSGFRAAGEVRLLRAAIAGDLDCSGSTFENPGNFALNADGLECRGSVFLCDASRAAGEVCLLGATIAYNLDCSGSTFENPAKDALSADGLECRGVLFLGHGASFRGRVSLPNASFGYFNDAPADGQECPWPEEILLSACRYDSLHSGAPLSWKERRVWLERHDATLRGMIGDDFDPQPYRQYATVMRKMGHDTAADDALRCAARKLAQQRVRNRLREARCYNPWRWFLGFVWMPIATAARTIFLDWLLGFGYKRYRILIPLIAFFLAGSYFFGNVQRIPSQAFALETYVEDGRLDPLLHHQNSWMDNYPKFNRYIFSADALIPLVSFHQEEYWTPASGAPSTFQDFVKSYYLPLHIASGWVLFTLFVASFTKLIRHE